MNTKKFYSTVTYKLFLVVCTLFSAVVTIGFLYFYFLSKAPIWVGLVFLVVTLSLGIRTINLFRYPEIIFNEEGIAIRGWFGGIKLLDPFSEMEVAGASDGFVIKQGKVGVALTPQSIGKKQLKDLLNLIDEVGEASNKKVHLTSLTLGK